VSKAYAAWRLEREALLACASRKSLSVQTVTSFARSDAGNPSQNGEKGDCIGAESRIVVETLEHGDFERPGGRRFGTLVHTLLASIDLNAGVDPIRALATANGRIVGTTEEEIEAAITTVRAVLAHPTLRRAAVSAGKGLRREAPIMLRLDDGRLVEGVVDLVFREDTPEFAGWTVVDFKTDRDFKVSSAQYTAQINLYTKQLVQRLAPQREASC
jgi:ATP-dependent exoDNAse (exonuclease V) beta subunit